MNAVDPNLPWFRHPMMWLVVAPPIAAVLGCMLCLWLILTHPDADVRAPHVIVAAARTHATNSVVPPVD